MTAASRIKDADRYERQALPTGPLKQEELHAIWLPRNHLAVWLNENKFGRVATGSLVAIKEVQVPRGMRAGQSFEVELAITSSGGRGGSRNEPPSPAGSNRSRVSR